MERNDYLEKKKLEMIENTNNLHKIWKERNNLLPKYKSPIYQKILYSEENVKENEKIKLENKKKLYNDKEKYCKEKIHLPPISNIQRREREKKKYVSLKKNLIKGKKNNLSIDNFKIINKKYNNNQNNKNNQSLNNSNEKKIVKSYSCSSIKSNNKINKINNQKGKIIISINKKNIKSNRNPNDFNYLEELRKERLTKNKNEIKNLNTNNNKEINLDAMKGQIQLLEEKYNRDKELLKIKGGYANNQELGDKVSELLVNSIKNKLDMIENMNK